MVDEKVARQGTRGRGGKVEASRRLFTMYEEYALFGDEACERIHFWFEN
ncbi:hypothetical protein [Nocardiopsis sp. LDBS1602]|nr:hypothetical protein [Nocardiopsis sp. LDBS1602]MEC3891153.1 hypothetical protein [Nocardiopsis sp. LDBS1602]